MHEDVKWLLRTFPWLGVLITGVFGFIALRGILEKQIGFSQYRYGAHTVYITVADKPMEYFLILAMLLILFMLALSYTMFRILKRRQLLQEILPPDED